MYITVSRGARTSALIGFELVNDHLGHELIWKTSILPILRWTYCTHERVQRRSDIRTPAGSTVVLGMPGLRSRRPTGRRIVTTADDTAHAREDYALFSQKNFYLFVCGLILFKYLKIVFPFCLNFFFFFLIILLIIYFTIYTICTIKKFKEN